MEWLLNGSRLRREVDMVQIISFVTLAVLAGSEY